MGSSVLRPDCEKPTIRPMICSSHWTESLCSLKECHSSVRLRPPASRAANRLANEATPGVGQSKRKPFRQAW